MDKMFNNSLARLETVNSGNALNACRNTPFKTESFFYKMYHVSNEIKLEYPYVDYSVSKLMLTVSKYNSLEEMELLDKEKFLEKNFLVNEKTYQLFVDKLRLKGYLK